MNNSNGENYRNMLAHFRVNDFKVLLKTFGQSVQGRRTELRKRALELLSSRPDGLNYIAYLSKIFNIYHSMHRQRQTTSMDQLQIAQQRTHQLPQYTQQSVHIPSAGLPQLKSKIEGLAHSDRTGASTFPRNTVANNHIQYAAGSSRAVKPQTVVTSQLPTNQQNASNLVLNPPTSGNCNASASIPSPQIVANYKFKKLTFYDVIKDIIKPTILDDSNSLEDRRECEFSYTMSIEDIDLIAKNRDISNGKCDYPLNCQIRICQLNQIVSTEVTDELPNGLFIRINGTVCPLPPLLLVRPGKNSKRIAEPINCAQFLKLNPLVQNRITINWSPGGNKYALAMYIIKQLSADTLVKKLHIDKVKSSVETKNDIIKKLTVVDPDLASTTAFNFSLVCPLSTVRMKIPAKSINCNHLQCFDASTFILMNEKRPKWICPTCHKSCLYDEIRIDGYFLEIVENLALREDIKEIGLLDDGSWVIAEKYKDNKNTNSTIDSTVIDLEDFESKEEPRPGCSKFQNHGNLEKSIFDLTIDEEEEPSKQKD